jgi:acetylornithine deacetylase/succinyl-diaminopimelate desuccinylase-like protein
LLLSHTDTVVADPAEWLVDPWSGEVRDGEVWGRGALDMKGQVAAEAVALASLAREGFEPAGDLVFAACATRRSAPATGFSGSASAIPKQYAPTTR